MQCIDTRGLTGLDERLNALLKELPGERRNLHQELAGLMEQEVRGSLPGSRKVAGWQESHVGSRGGYAAIRPQKGSLPARRRGRSYAFGQITNAVENGHRVRPWLSSKPKTGKRTIEKAFVPGRHFYRKAGTSVEAKAIRMAERFANRLAERLEG